MPTLVVFDTCTKPPYYTDVHKLLALPAGTYLRYDYEEKLFSEGALAVLREATSASLPIDAILFYGQFNTYKKAEPDPLGVFAIDNSILIPTRYAKIRNVAFDPKIGGNGQPRTNIIFHMELLGFPDPDAPAIPGLMQLLANRGEMPFSKWIAKVPDDADLVGLREKSTNLWGKVVDRLASHPSQFNGDVFWRIGHLEKISGSTAREIVPTPRTTNVFGGKEFFADYELNPLSDYRVTITNIVPGAENKELPAKTSVTAIEDTTKLLGLPERARELRRNDGAQFTFTVHRVDEMTTRYAKLLFETMVKDHTSPYPAGSVAEISIAVQSSGYRLAGAIMLAAFAAAAGIGATAVAKNGEVLAAEVLGVVGVVLLVAASFAFFGKLKIPGLKD